MSGLLCAHWIGVERRYCHSADQVRPYIQGNRCPGHTPNALAGKPEVPPGPGRPRAWAAPPPAPTPNPRGKRHLAVVGTREEAS